MFKDPTVSNDSLFSVSIQGDKTYFNIPVSKEEYTLLYLLLSSAMHTPSITK